MSEASMKIFVSEVLREAGRRQEEASDPAVSSWVGASAGSGKTKVLTDRILRLLLPREDGRPGSAPEKILALTFTKAGANEMALRLSKRLSAWAVISEEKLAEDMETRLLGRAPRPDERESARKLFARVIDTPGGLNIMTIHSFCQSVLGRFPIEAGLPPGFRPLEEAEAAELLDQARRDILSHARMAPGSPSALAVAQIGTLMNEEQFGKLLKTMIAERDQLHGLLRRTFGIDGLYTQICRMLDIAPGLTEAQAFTDFCLDGGEDRERTMRNIVRALTEDGTAKEKGNAADIQTFWDAPQELRRPLFKDYKKLFLTADNTPKAPTKKVRDYHPSVEAAFAEEAVRILAYEDMPRRIACANVTRDLFLLAHTIEGRYTELKHRRGALDFDDLILRTLALFKGAYGTQDGLAMAPWVLYKMDEGLDHILVDEAQDTNPEQWEIIQILSEEFFSGIGARDETDRTVFVVGDDKQSIFGFQRAAPEKFGDMFQWFDRIIAQAEKRFRPVDITTSFRSVQAVLDAVDAVFDGTAAGTGLGHRYLRHKAIREGQAGLVEIWPLCRPTQPVQGSAPDSGWFLPDTIQETQSGSLKMAIKISDTIKSWLDAKEHLQSYDRPIRPEDILILVRSRGAFVTQLVRHLKKRAIRVSGVDRMVLADQLAVQDLCAAAMFALCPEDDLTLATLLKSPLIGFDDDALFALCHGRTGTLWKSVQKIGDSALLIWLRALIEYAASATPYAFFARLLQEPCPASAISGMRAIRFRLGEDALDPLDEFLNAALLYESSHTASLQGFLQWHESGSTEIKRQLEEGSGAVRIMTVHAAKGLQAPIVFLPDTTRTAASNRPDQIVWPNKSGLPVPVYIPSKASMPEGLQDTRTHLEARMDEEYRRLLYVAMTRAEERLYIGGYLGKRTDATTNWYNDVYAAFNQMDDIQRIEDPAETDAPPLLRLQTQATRPPDKKTDRPQTPQGGTVLLQPWMLEKRPQEPHPPAPLVPSRPSGETPAAASPREAGNNDRFRRGIFTHRLLQLLPDLPLKRRAEAMQSFLSRPGLNLSPALQESIAQEVAAILNDRAFAPIFGPGSLAEVPVTGLLDGGRLISGQMDRLLITDEDILIIDYKTNRPPPMTVEDVPAIYMQQMKAYADTLAAIYPGRRVRGALLWTDGARLMELPL